MKEYFSHDYNSRHDRKIVALLNKYKSAGYGIFWATNEMMHEEGGELELDQITFDAIAKHLNEDPIYIETVINDCINIFKLYNLSGEKLSSNRVNRNLSDREEKKTEKVIAGRLGGIKSGQSRRSKQNEALLEAGIPLLEATKQRKLKETKGKEIKGDKIIGKEIKTSFPVSESIDKLPEMKISAAIELIKISQGLDVTRDQINSFWVIFKIQNLTGENYYASADKVYSHFINWVKTQKIKNGSHNFKGGTSANGSGISGTSVIPTDKKYSGKL